MILTRRAAERVHTEREYLSVASLRNCWRHTSRLTVCLSAIPEQTLDRQA